MAELVQMHAVDLHAVAASEQFVTITALLRMAQVGAGSTRQPFDFYLAAALLYLVITTISGFGLSAAERIVAVSEAHRRVSWSAQSERLAHHNASAQVLAGDEPSSCRVRWCVDLLPDAMAPAIETMVLAGLQAMRQTLEGL